MLCIIIMLYLPSLFSFLECGLILGNLDVCTQSLSMLGGFCYAALISG